MPLSTLLEGVDTGDLRRHCERRKARLVTARQPWLDYCTSVAEELIPNRLPYLLTPGSEQKAGEQNRNIVDATGHLSLGTAASGIATGTMPPTSKWFDLAVRGEFSQDDDLKLFLQEACERMLAMHNQSNAANVFPESQREWIGFGTAAALILEDQEDLYRIDGLTVGEYCIADDRRGRVDTLYRELTLTVGQLASEFGVDRLGASSRAAYERGDYDQVVRCTHAIEPDRDGRNPLGQHADMPWRSVYYEDEASCTQVLAVRQYKRFPALVWRMTKLPGSAYGYGRGHEALPHLVRLRRMIYNHGQAMAEQARPPVQIPGGMAQHEVRTLPDAKSITPAGGGKIENLRQVSLDLSSLEEEMERTRQQIRDVLGATLVASLRPIRHQMTAREADLRTAQDLTEWLPELYRLNDELMNPYIEWLWDIAFAYGQMPQDMPRALRDQPIDIEFTSPLARKQRQGEVDGIVRTFAAGGEISKTWPEAKHYLDAGEAVRRISEIEGAPHQILVPLERVHELQAAEADAKLAQARAAAAQQGVDIAKTGAEAQSLTVGAA